MNNYNNTEITTAVQLLQLQPEIKFDKNLLRLTTPVTKLHASNQTLLLLLLLLPPFYGPLDFVRDYPVSRYQTGKTNLDLLEHEKVSSSDISWAICKSAPRSRQITTPESHHSVLQT